MQESTLVLHPETNTPAYKIVTTTYEAVELEQVSLKVEQLKDAVVAAQAYALSVARGVVDGSQDITQLSLAIESEDKAKAAFEDSKSELERVNTLVAAGTVSGEVPAEEGSSSEDTYNV